jgi:RNA polymerase sigma-70 factor (ECF subfamily)
MSTLDEIRDLYRRIQSDDADVRREAGLELVERYGPEIRRAIHHRLTDPRLRRLFDTLDICQSAFGAFFEHVGGDGFVLDQPESLLCILHTLAHNKFREYVRRHQAKQRDVRRQAGGDAPLGGLIDKQRDPGQDVAERELVQQVLLRLSPENRYLVTQRAEGRDWGDLAGELNTTPDQLRMRWNRAREQLIQELRQEESHA